MSLNSVIKMGCILSKEDIEGIFEAALDMVPYHGRNNGELYDEGARQHRCPGEHSCSVQDLMFIVASAASEHFSKVASSILIKIEGSAVT